MRVAVIDAYCINPSCLTKEGIVLKAASLILYDKNTDFLNKHNPHCLNRSYFITNGYLWAHICQPFVTNVAKVK